MARIKGLGITIAVAALALATAPTASATAPEFGRCVKVATGSGLYATNNCTSEGGEKKFEWLAGPGPKNKFTESVTGEKAFKAKLAGNEEHICTEESATGEYTGPKTVGNVRITLRNCSKDCENIVLEPMHGELGVYEHGETALTDKLGLKLMPEVGEFLSEFNCGASVANPFMWRGGWVIGALTSNKMLIKGPRKYRYHKPSQYGVEQLPQGFLGETPDPLESTTEEVAGGKKEWQPMAWAMATKMVNEEKIEASSVR
jgi:hypothetical protein